MGLPREPVQLIGNKEKMKKIKGVYTGKDWAMVELS
jgi:hypothetical protein